MIHSSVNAFCFQVNYSNYSAKVGADWVKLICRRKVGVHEDKKINYISWETRAVSVVPSSLELNTLSGLINYSIVSNSVQCIYFLDIDSVLLFIALFLLLSFCLFNTHRFHIVCNQTTKNTIWTFTEQFTAAVFCF